MNVTAGNIIEETNYDAWGRVRNPNDWTYTNAQPLTTIFRGYTGHEMLPEFGLINMNGRMYDPLLGRMLSPDNYVQDPANPQNYNRYAYVLNNPLKYTDPSGEIIGTAITFLWDLGTTIFTKGGLDFRRKKSSEARRAAWRDFDPTRQGSKTNNAWKIDKGMFAADTDLEWYQQVWQVTSRFTFWEGPQSFYGNLNAHNRNIQGHVETVHFFHGATVLDVTEDAPNQWHNVGNYIKVETWEGIAYTDLGNMTRPSQSLIHEYGHYQQSRQYGFPGYIMMAIQSGARPNERTDVRARAERDASNKGVEYFQNTYNMESFIDVWPNQSLPLAQNLGFIYMPQLFVINRIFY